MYSVQGSLAANQTTKVQLETTALVPVYNPDLCEDIQILAIVFY